ncbi:MAG: glycosyltransferase family 1 protein [Chitinophagaceae bacterium]
MPRFARMLAEGMNKRGHSVKTWSPQPLFFRLPLPRRLRKWLGYLDQYLIFPRVVKSRLKQCPADTLFVFTDQALGPWVPLLAGRVHAIHCHDFLAQRSALLEIPENPTGWTGRQYQAFIRRGYSKGKHFISVSQKTKEDLHRFLPSSPCCSEVVYNGLNQSFVPYNAVAARTSLGKKTGLELSSGFLLHVGGNYWYKNRSGVIKMYNAWRSAGGSTLPLLLVGETPTQSLLKTYLESSFKSDIHFISGLEDEFVRQAYAGALVLVFPSLAEGFGWPIAEAMASGCPVITTNEAPMTEVAGNVGFFIPCYPQDESRTGEWAADAAKMINKVLSLAPSERKAVVEAGLVNASRFDSDVALDRIEAIYRNILQQPKNLEYSGLQT